MGEVKYWFMGFGGLFLASLGGIVSKYMDSGMIAEILSTLFYVSGLGLIVYTVVKTKLFD